MTLQTCSPPVVMKMDAPSSKATCVLVKLKSLSWVVCLVLIHMSECPKTHIFFLRPPFDCRCCTPAFPRENLREILGLGRCCLRTGSASPLCFSLLLK